MANISVSQIIIDAQRMASRVKDLDTLGSSLLVEAEGNNRLVESLRQFQDDIDVLNRISNNKSNAEMVNRIQQQNANSSEILKENRELKICIEDYEKAMEMIMHKYREHAHSKVLDTKLNFKELYNEKLWTIIKEQREKINEMAAVMRRAVAMDEDDMLKEQEQLARLRLENQTLREMLQISKQFGTYQMPIRINELLLQEKGVQTDPEDAADELILSGASIENDNENENVNNNTAVYGGGSANSSLTTSSVLDTAVMTNDNTTQTTIACSGDNNNGSPVTCPTNTLPTQSPLPVAGTGNAAMTTTIITTTTTATNTPPTTAVVITSTKAAPQTTTTVASAASIVAATTVSAVLDITSTTTTTTTPSNATSNADTINENTMNNSAT